MHEPISSIFKLIGDLIFLFLILLILVWGAPRVVVHISVRTLETMIWGCKVPHFALSNKHIRDSAREISPFEHRPGKLLLIPLEAVLPYLSLSFHFENYVTYKYDMQIKTFMHILIQKHD